MPPLDPLPDHEGFTLVHSADLHLGSGMRIAKTVGREADLKDATFEALDNLVSLVDAEEAEILTLGGDLFDEPNLLNPGPRHRLADALRRIPDTRVAIVRGNHDHHHRNAPEVQWPANVFEFGGDHKTLGLGWVRVHGVSYTQARETQSLLPRYPAASPDHFDIGLLHANVGGVEGHADYSPCALGDLQGFGYRMWLLGHIHKARVLSDEPLIVYPGNLQGRDIGETGPKTAEVIEVSGSGTIQRRAEPVHSVLWERIDVDVAGAGTIDDAIDRIERRLEDARRQVAARGLITRIRLVGATDAHRALGRVDAQGSAAEAIQTLLNDRFGGRDPFVLVDKVQVATSVPLDLERLAASDDIAGLLVRMADDPALRKEIVAELADGGPEGPHELEAMAEGLWSDALQSALVRLRGGGPRAD